MSATGIVGMCSRVRSIVSCVTTLLLLMIFCGAALAQYRHHEIHRHHRYHRHHLHRQHYHPVAMKIDPSKFEDTRCAAMNAYFESDNNLDEMFESQFMIAYVTLQRANKGKITQFFEKLFGGKTLCGVTYARVQFSWTIAHVCHRCQKWIRLQDAPKGYKWDSARYAAQMVLDGWKPGDIALDPTLNRATYYFNPIFTSARIACTFRRSYVRLAHGVRVGGHEFYALPTDAEQKMLDEAHKDPRNQCVPVDALKIP